MSSRSRTTKTRGRAQKAGGSPIAKLAARLLIWMGLVAALAALLYGSYWGAKRLFFAANPHFTLKHLDIRASGQLTPPEVAALLAAQGIQTDQSNLFGVDLKSVRQTLEGHILIDSASVSRQFPHTLRVAIFERRPLARLGRYHSNLIDAQGTILPPRKDAEALGLPIIAGVRHARKLDSGMQSDDALLLAALRTLVLLATRPSGNYYDVMLLHLDYSSETLKLYLRERPPFRKGSLVLLPSKQIEAALDRLDVVVAERRQAGQQTSFIDATYQTNVPVLP